LTDGPISRHDISMRIPIVCTAALVLWSTLANAAPASPSPSGGAAESQRLYTEAMAAGNSGDFTQCIALQKRAIAADPQNFLAHFDLGGAYEQLDRSDEAVSSYEKTVALRSDFVEAQTQLGTLYLLKVRDYPRAAETLKQALLIKKPYIDARFPIAKSRAQALRNLAIAHAQMGHYGLATGIATSVLSDPSLPQNDQGWAPTLIMRAGRDLKANQTHPFNDSLNPIRTQLHGGHPDVALREYQAFVKTHPIETLPPVAQWDVLEGQGLGAILTQHFAEAAEAFTKSVQIAHKLRYQQLQESLFNRACALAQLGKPADALAVLEQLLWIDYVTQYDDAHQGKKPYRLKIQSDSDLQRLKKEPGLQTLLSQYAAP
jgi:tetratricopeptide (TPR) repeat protein